MKTAKTGDYILMNSTKISTIKVGISKVTIRYKFHEFI